MKAGNVVARLIVLFTILIVVGCASAPKMYVREITDNNGNALQPDKCYRVNEMMGAFGVGGSVDQEHALVCVGKDGLMTWQTTTASSGPNTGHVLGPAAINTTGEIVMTQMRVNAAKHIANQEAKAQQGAAPGVVFQVKGGTAEALTNTEVGVTTKQAVRRAPAPAVGPLMGPPSPPSAPPALYVPRTPPGM